MDTSQRMVWLDALRLTAGVSMVVLHATADPNGQPWVDYPPSDRIGPILIRTVIYSARTELFLIISAFLLLLALEHRPRSYGQTIRQQMRRLLLPFAFWVVFYAGYNLIKAEAFGYAPALLAQLTNPAEWVGYFLLGDIKYHMHFLPTLFGLVLFFPLFKCARRWPAIGFGILVCLLVKRELDGFLWGTFTETEALPYLVRTVKILTYVGYGLIAGAALGILDKSTAKQREAWMPLLGFAAVLLILIKTVGAWKTVQFGAWPHSYTAGFWADFLMPALLFLVCMCCGHWRWPAVISRIAPFSFGIYLCHPIFLDLAEVALRDAGWTPVTQVLAKVCFALPATTLLVILISRSMLFAWIVGLGPLPKLRRSPPTNRSVRMLLDVEFHGNGIAIFRATRGELHASSLQRLEELCEVMQRQGKVGIILELSGLRRVSASGLAALVELVSLRRDQEIGICSAPEKLVQLIEQLGLYRGLPLYPDLESTLRSDQFQRCHLRGLRSLVLCSTRSRGALDQAGPAEMLDVLGKPLLHRVLDKLASHGCSIAYLKAGKDARKLASYFSVERVTGQSQFLLGTEMGAASEELGVLLRHLVDSQIPDQEDLLILPADQLNEADLGAFAEQHRKAQADLSVLVTEAGTKGAACDHDMDLWEPSAVLIRPGQIPQLPAQGCQSLGDLASYMRRKKRKVAVCRTDCRFLPIGDEISYHAALASLMSSTMNNVQPKARELGHGIWQAEGSHVSVDAKIDGPVFVGEGAEVPRDVRIIGPAVIGAGVRIPSKTLIRNSVILSDKSLQIGALVDGKLVLSDRQVSLTAPGTARDILPIQHAIENLDDIEVSQERMA